VKKIVKIIKRAGPIFLFSLVERLIQVSIFFVQDIVYSLAILAISNINSQYDQEIYAFVVGQNIWRLSPFSLLLLPCSVALFLPILIGWKKKDKKTVAFYWLISTSIDLFIIVFSIAYTFFKITGKAAFAASALIMILMWIAGFLFVLRSIGAIIGFIIAKKKKELEKPSPPRPVGRNKALKQPGRVKWW